MAGTSSAARASGESDVFIHGIAADGVDAGVGAEAVDDGLGLLLPPHAARKNMMLAAAAVLL
ncbi:MULTISPECIES: hypothetical protein [Burkholderiaceae]|uniref:hypothetical protein n=1 Tax=Burkholderiaceae TaxID=119060 RepID=UPI001F040613|nr:MULTISPECIES: hypothetical protein [Burkholderiaceae]